MWMGEGIYSIGPSATRDIKTTKKSNKDLPTDPISTILEKQRVPRTLKTGMGWSLPAICPKIPKPEGIGVGQHVQREDAEEVGRARQGQTA